MLERAAERVSQESNGCVTTIHGDFRTANLADGSYDVIIAAAVLHHLRDEQDWIDAFTKIHRLLRPGGSFWITDLVTHENQSVHDLMWKRYGDYLETKGGEDYRDKVFDYIDQEDSPRPAGILDRPPGHQGRFIGWLFRQARLRARRRRLGRRHP